METESRELVERASQGDAPAVEALLALHLSGLREYVRHRVGALVAARESPSDLVQSACREVLEHLERFRYDGEEGFRRWLYRSALRKIQDRHRYWQAARRDARRDVPLAQPVSSASAPDLAALFATHSTPSRAAAAFEEQAALRAALEELSERYREVIRLAHVEGLPHAEIAARMGINETNARVLLSRALARLARVLSERGGGPSPSSR